MAKKRAWMAALLAGLLLLTGCGADALPQEEIPVEGDPLMRDTLVYYEQDDGLLVPVVVQEEWSETMLTSLAERLVANELEQLDLEEDRVTLDSNILEDFEADSLALVDLVMSLEDEFGIEVPDEQVENFHTVGDVVRYIEDNT